MVNKKVVIITTIIITIAIGLMVAFKINESKDTVGDLLENNTTKTEETTDKENTQNSIENSIEENENTNSNVEEDENTTNTSNENVDNENLSNSSENTIVDNSITSSSEPENETDEEKALRLAREKWSPKDNNVYYYVEEIIDADIYIISVRDKETTRSLANYEVNIELEEVSDY